MKTLLLMRHAKSSWKEESLQDSDRPLTRRGEKTAIQIGEYLHEHELRPELALTSSANRTRQTAELVLSTFEDGCQTISTDHLYMAEPDAILDALHAIPDSVERVLVVGHNPGMECLAQLLTGEITVLPSAGLSNISLPITSWKKLADTTSGELVQLWRPAESQ